MATMGWSYDSENSKCTEDQNGFFISKEACLQNALNEENIKKESGSGALKTAKSALKGIGTYGIWKCIIVGGIFFVIGLVLMIWAFTLANPHSVKITRIEEPWGKNLATCYTTYDDGTTKPYSCYKYSQKFDVILDGDTISIHNTTSTNYKEGASVKIVEDVGGDYRIYQGAKPVLIWTGAIFGFISLASGLFCYLLRNNEWFKGIMGIKTTVDIGKSIFGR